MAEALPFKTSMNFAYDEPRELAKGVVRIVANNPSPFTFKGTNTYLVGSGVGSGSLAVIDPGPEDPAHLESILSAAGGRPITHVVITHTHRDHTAGMSALLARTGARTAGFGHRARNRGSKRTSPSGSEFVEGDFTPDVPLCDGERLAGEGWALVALHTPGHAPDHLCFALEGTRLLFSGDHVMGWNTSVVAPPEGNMRAYLRSLELLLGRDDGGYLPGHGGQVEDPQRLVRAYLLHRRLREQAILECIRGGSSSVRDIVPVIYKGLDPRLLNAASLSVLAHVEHLIERGLVTCGSPPSFDRDLSVA